jgi:sec-independent protein translocase protein TatA
VRAPETGSSSGTIRRMGSGVLQPTHLIFLLLLAVLLFGAKRLPEIGRGLGKGMREFKDSVSGLSDITSAANEVRSAASPANMAGALIPGVKEVRETVSEAKNLTAPAAAAEEVAPAPATTPAP